MLTFIILAALMPEAIWQGGSNLVHLLLHKIIVIFIAMAISFVHAFITQADEWQNRANAAIDRLQSSSEDIKNDLSITSDKAERLEQVLVSFNAEVSARLDRL